MQIENERYRVSFTLQGGEMTEFYDKETGIQYLYQGNHESWSGKNPTLFPIIGNTFDQTYTIDGKTYQMKNHGLIRYATMCVKKQCAESITLQFCANEETKKQYPFAFQYEITYTLNKEGLTISYRIENQEEEDMPFQFGLHPAFRCPLEEGESWEDYTLSFTSEEQVRQLLFDPNKEKPLRYQDVTCKDIPLSYEWILRDATVIYEGCRSPYVTLKGKNHGVRVSIMGYPYVAFWTPCENAPFLCIEPWMGHGDFEAGHTDFYSREGTMLLKGKKTFTAAYTISVF